MTPYERVYDLANAFTDPAWALASDAGWQRLEMIASEFQRGEYDWTKASRLVADTAADEGVQVRLDLV